MVAVLGVVTGVVVTVVLACVGFVVVLVAVGVRRIRNAGRHSRHRRAVAAAAADITGVSDDRQEMEWDNSALTITVNPMEQQVGHHLCSVVVVVVVVVVAGLCSHHHPSRSAGVPVCAL